MDDPEPPTGVGGAWLVVVGAILAVGTACAYVIAAAFPASSIVAAAALGLLLVVGGRFETVINGAAISGDFVAVVVACLVAPRWAPVVAATVMLLPTSSMRARLLNGLMYQACAGVTLGALAGATDAGVALGLGDAGLVLAQAIVCASVFSTSNILVNGLIATTCGIGDMRLQLVHAARSAPLMVALSAPPVALVALLYRDLWILCLPLAAVTLAVVHRLHSMYYEAFDMSERLADSNARLRDSNERLARANAQFATAMVGVLEARDPYTAGHSAAVARYARDIAVELGCDAEIQRAAYLAGILHDIGKVGVSSSVLNKAGMLDDQEREQMQRHPVIGAQVLAQVEAWYDIALAVRWHHERLDGLGYPDGLAEASIPLVSRIIAVADTYSAMTTDRPYRRGMAPSRARRILREVAGSQLDEVCVEAFLRVLSGAPRWYQRGGVEHVTGSVADNLSFHPEVAPGEGDARPAAA